MTHLSVNVNKVATLRNTRHLGIPSVLRAAQICLDAGAQGITIHPRPDQRHIRPQDVSELTELLKSYPGREFNIEGNPFEGDYLAHIQNARPAQCTLVPDDVNAFTSNQGWQLQANSQRLRPLIARLKGLGCRVSLFMDATSSEWALAKDLGADRVELYTEPYAAAFSKNDPAAADAFAKAAIAAQRAGLQVNAGHDLNLHNLPHFLKTVPNVLEVSIGHAFMADALEMGLAQTTRSYLAACAAN